MRKIKKTRSTLIQSEGSKIWSGAAQPGMGNMIAFVVVVVVVIWCLLYVLEEKPPEEKRVCWMNECVGDGKMRDT